MFALPLAAQLGLALLAAPTDATRPPLPTCEMGVRHLELAPDAADRRFTVCIHPGLSTNLFFDSKLARVELAGRERFRVVLPGDNALTLVPSEALADGERVTLTVYFQDGVDPTSVTFELVVHPSQAEGQVEVTRHLRTLASYREGEQQARAEAQQCREERARLQATSCEQVGLTALIAQGRMGKGGVAFKELNDDVTARPGNALELMSARSYRSDTERTEGAQKVVRLAAELELKNTGMRPWTPSGAVLVGPGNKEVKVLGVWLQKPMAPEQKGRVVVEAEMMEGEARGTFTLKLWNQEDSAQDEFFDGVTFPF